MSFDALILESGEWVLSREHPAPPWHLLVYAQRNAPHNELHVWLHRRAPGHGARGVFRRFWKVGSVRWCVEVDSGEGLPRAASRATRIRFSSPHGTVLWAEDPEGRGLGDLSDADLHRLLRTGRPDQAAGPRAHPRRLS